MRITEDTLYTDFFAVENCLTSESEKALEEAVFAKYPRFLNLSIKELFECIRGDFSVIGLQAEKAEKATALQGFWVKMFKTFIESFIKTIESYSVPQTADMKKAAERMLKQKFEESVLIFCREYFNLPSFTACYDLHLTDYVLAKRDAYNKAVFERTMAEITTAKFKAK